MSLRIMNGFTLLAAISACTLGATGTAAETYPIVDTGQRLCFDNRRPIADPKPGEPFFGQDAQYVGRQPAYRDNGDGTITDLVTGLMWTADPGRKKTFRESLAGAAACRVGSYDDWRLPKIKELYSLIVFSGEDVDPRARPSSDLRPFIDTRYFKFSYGDPAKGERIIDSQMVSCTKYVSTTMWGNETVFGVNFADGRIKGYPISVPRPGRPEKTFYVFYVRGNPEYGKNRFHDNGDGTITDRATGLMWAKYDSGHFKASPFRNGTMNWEQALRWAEELVFAGYSDWRLPNIKELHSIVDYTRSPDATGSAAIDPMFQVTEIRDARGRRDYPCYWSSTTHKRRGGVGSAACYLAFGRGLGWMPGPGGRYQLLDVHGAGCQRSDPKTGDPSRSPYGRGPQGDVVRIYNMVRVVRAGPVQLRGSGPPIERQGRSQRPAVPPRKSRPARVRRAKPPRKRLGHGLGPNRPRGPLGGMAPRRGGRRFIERLDRDGDGKVSADQFGGPPRASHRLDADGDGYLTEQEAPRPTGRRATFLRGRLSVNCELGSGLDI